MKSASALFIRLCDGSAETNRSPRAKYRYQISHWTVQYISSSTWSNWSCGVSLDGGREATLVDWLGRQNYLNKVASSRYALDTCLVEYTQTILDDKHSPTLIYESTWRVIQCVCVCSSHCTQSPSCLRVFDTDNMLEQCWAISGLGGHTR